MTAMLRWSLILLVATLVGCGDGAEEGATQRPTAPEDQGSSAANGAADTGAAQRGTAESRTPQKSAARAATIAESAPEPFSPPALEELDATVNWIDQPIADTLDLLRRRQQAETPLTSESAALAMPNDSREANAKIASALGRVATSDALVDFDAVMNRHIRADVKSMNPVLYSSAIEAEVHDLTSLSLFTYDDRFERYGSRDAIVSWQTSSDRLVDKVVLRDDLTWSDGQPVTAHDVAFSYRMIMDPEVPVPAVRSGTDKLRWVQAYDDRTVVFFHKEALATNAWNVNFPVIPRHIYEQSLAEDKTLTNSDYHVKYERNPVCGGPYAVDRRVQGQEIVLKRRESWYLHNGQKVRDMPYFKEVRFRIISDPNTALLALKKGDLDEMMLTAEQWITQTNDAEFYERNTKVSATEWTSFQFAWNLESPFFSDVRVRRALALAFDYKEMHERLNYGLYEPCNGIFHPTAWMSPKPPPPYYTQDQDQAEELLDDAGWSDHDGDGIRDKEIGGQRISFEFNLLCPSIPERVKLCALLKQSLEQIGIICNVQPLEFTVLTERVFKHEFQAAFGGWGTGTDPDTSHNIWVTGEGRNYGKYSNPAVDRLFIEGRREFDRAKRAAIYGKIHNLIYADQPYMWLYYRNAFYAFSKQLRGYTFSPRGPYSFGPGFSSIYKVRR
jgi:peptide/nickel transport system substrate-binding protein